MQMHLFLQETDDDLHDVEGNEHRHQRLAVAQPPQKMAINTQKPWLSRDGIYTCYLGIYNFRMGLPWIQCRQTWISENSFK